MPHHPPLRRLAFGRTTWKPNSEVSGSWPASSLCAVFPVFNQRITSTSSKPGPRYVCLGVWACPVSPQGAFAVAGLSGKLLDQDPSAWHWQLVPCCSLWAAVAFMVTNPVMCPGLRAPRLTLSHPWQGVGPVSLFPSVYFLFARRYPRAPFSALQLSTPGLRILWGQLGDNSLPPWTSSIP